MYMAMSPLIYFIRMIHRLINILKIPLHQKYNSFEFQIPNTTKIYFIYGLDTLITNHKQKVMNVSRNHTVSLFCAFSSLDSSRNTLLILLHNIE